MGITRKLTIAILAALAMMVVLTPFASASENDPSENNDDSSACTQQQIEGGYENTADGGCALTGWNWNFGGACPRSVDASVGDWGSVNCSTGVCESCNPIPGNGGPGADSDGDSGLACISPDETWTDEEGGQFSTETAQDFVDCCIEFGGDPVFFDIGQGEAFHTCLLGDTNYDCWQAVGAPLMCRHQDSELTPAPAPQTSLDATAGTVFEGRTSIATATTPRMTATVTRFG